MKHHHSPTPEKQQLRLLIADDAPRSRAGLRALLATLRLSSPVPHHQVQAGQVFGLKGSAAELPALPTRQVEVVGEAANGREAVRLMEEFQPDVVLMDARMPVMDGIQATRLIKDRWPAVKLVVLSMCRAFQAEALAAGADAFLVKGCTPEELLEAICGSTG